MDQVQPTHVLDATVLPGLRSAAVSPDGTRVYAYLHTNIVDLGAAFSHHVPEVAAAVSVLLAMVCVLVMVRRARRPQKSGELYCRKCNYHLAGAQGERCPECGVEFEKLAPVLGHGVMRRLAMPVAMVVLVVAGFWCVRAFVGRGSARMTPVWAVEDGAWADHALLKWMKRFRTQGEEVREIDPVRGVVVRRVLIRGGASYCELTLTPDGTGVYLPSADWRGVDLLNLTNGRVRAQFRSGALRYDTGARVVIDHLSDQEPVLSYWHEPGDAYAAVWNTVTGDVRVLATTRPHSSDVNGRLAVWGREFLVRDRAPQARVVSTPVFMEAMDTQSFAVRVFDAQGKGTAEYDLGSFASPSARPVVTRDGSVMFLVDRGMSACVGVDVDSGRVLGRLRHPRGAMLWHFPRLSPDGAWLLLASGDGIAVRDIGRKEWVGELMSSSGLIAAMGSIDVRKTCAAATAQARGAGGGGQRSLMIWSIPAEWGGASGGQR